MSPHIRRSQAHPAKTARQRPLGWNPPTAATRKHMQNKKEAPQTQRCPSSLTTQPQRKLSAGRTLPLSPQQ
jgi:hypothetical protein